MRPGPFRVKMQMILCRSTCLCASGVDGDHGPDLVDIPNCQIRLLYQKSAWASDFESNDMQSAGSQHFDQKQTINDRRATGAS